MHIFFIKGTEFLSGFVGKNCEVNANRYVAGHKICLSNLR